MFRESTFFIHPVLIFCNSDSRSQWPLCLRRKSAATRLLELRVRIMPVHGGLSVVGVVSCQVEASATGRSLVQGSPTLCTYNE